MTSPILTRPSAHALRFSSRAAISIGLLAFSAQAQVFDPPEVVPIQGSSVPFSILDSVEGTNVDFVLSAMDGMALDSAQRLFALNTHHSKALRFDDPANSLQPDLVFDTPVGPVGIATWVSSLDGHEEVLVISRSSYALSVFDPDTGALVDSMPLPSEPAHLLVVGDVLYISCSADSLVVEIDLLLRQEIHRYSLDGAIAYSRMFESNGLIYVTAQHSGNNSLVLRSRRMGEAQVGEQYTLLDNDPVPILDLNDPTISANGMPDEDVMCINPSTQSVTVATRNVGTTLAAGAVHPTTGAAWILNMEANNKDPLAQGEAKITGIFIENRVTITSLGGNGSPPVFAGASPSDSFVSLDELSFVPGVESVGHPYDLTFDSSGNGYVIGLLTDNVVRLTSAGVPDKRWNLGRGRIPRDILLMEQDGIMLVSCWGTNDVAVVDLTAGGLRPDSLDLGYDPTSPIRKAGRALFYDGHNSALRNASCESCHIEGVQDFLAWDLSDLPADNKGPLQTQSLRGIEPLNPYHWRGERSFKDFNVAFPGLLGGTELTDEEFAEFQAFVFGMQEPANPRTHPERVLVDDEPSVMVNFNVRGDTLHPNLSGGNGQNVYLTAETVGPASCQDCHALPTGTTNDFFHDGIIDQEHRGSFDVPAYNGLWRKEQKSRVTLDLLDENGDPDTVQNDRPPLGVGTTHAGNTSGVYEFVVDGFQFQTDEERQDMALFMHQIDSGVAPSAHGSALLDIDHTGAGPAVEYLRRHAMLGNSDLACFGTVTIGGTDFKMRWFYDVDSNFFIPEDSTQQPRRLRFFINKAANGTASTMFVGLPRGMGRRWSIDYDDDGLLNEDERNAGTDPYTRDSDRDGFLDGVEVAGGSLPLVQTSVPPNDGAGPGIDRLDLVYTTAKVAKFIVESDEPATLQVDYTIDGVPAPGSPLTFTTLGSHFVVFLRDLVPSYTTTGAVRPVVASFRLTDSWGNVTTQTEPPFDPMPFIVAVEQTNPSEPIDEVLLAQFENLSQTPPAVAGDPYELVFEATVHHQKDLDNPARADHAVIARVLIKEPGATEFVPAEEGDFTIGGFPQFGPPFAAPELVWDDLFGIFTGGGAGVYPIAGPFAVSTPSDANGKCTLTIQLDKPMGTEVYLSVETVGLVDPATYPFDLPLPEAIPSIEGVFHFPATATEHRTTEIQTLN